MRVNELFFSVQGEGIYTGLPTAFVRLQGCNVRCKWCDTAYAQDFFGGKEVSPNQIRSEVIRLAPNVNWVCITGGEPLFQREDLEMLVRTLKEREYKIEIETNGTIPPPVWYEQVDSWNADVKCPSAGVTLKTDEAWFKMRTSDQLKFVVSGEADLKFVEETLLLHKDILPTILISPVINLMRVSSTRKDYLIASTWLQRCVEFVKEHNLRLSLQVHKFIWGATQRGV